MNPAIDHLPAREKKQLREIEARRRKSGDWGPWEHVPLPQGVPGSTGWPAGVRVAHRNGVFAVMERPLPDGTTHLMVSSLTGRRPTWPEMQRIKNELVSPQATAVEIYPPDDQVVDEADAYHLWTLPQGFPHSLRPAPLAGGEA